MMGTVTGTLIITRCRKTLADEAPGVVWSDDELLSNLNEAIGQISSDRQDIYVKSTAFQCVAGIEQALPSDAIVLQNIPRNLGHGGTCDGSVIRQVDMDTMDRVSPSWPSDEPSMTIIHFIYDIDDPKRFYVWPPASQQRPYVKLIASYIAPPLAAVGDPIPIDDNWDTALFYFVMARCHMKDATQAHADKAAGYLKLYAGQLGGEEVARQAVAASEAKTK